MRDQISHLWFFDERRRLAITDPEASPARRPRLLDALAAGDGSVRRTRAADRPGRAARRLARRAARRCSTPLRPLDPKTRIPWYGPAMGARSFVTARLMETWAHGQDVADALGRRTSADRRGCATSPTSACGPDRSPTPSAGSTMPDVELSASSSWPRTVDRGRGDPTRRRRPSSTGDALDFCLVVTQRRHLADTGAARRRGRRRPSGWASPRPSPDRRARAARRASSPAADGRDRAGYRFVDQLEHLGRGGADPARPCSASRSRTRRRKASSWSSSVAFIVDSNWLAWASSAASLASTEAVDVLGVVGLVGLPQQQRPGPVVGEALLGEEVRVAGGDDAVAGQQAGMAMVGVEAVALPRIVAEHDVGPQQADDPGHLAARGEVAVELAVDLAEEHDRRRVAPSALAAARCSSWRSGDECGGVGRRVPGALRAVGAARGGARRSRRRPTWPACRRTRTRRRRDGRRWPAPTPATGEVRGQRRRPWRSGGVGRVRWQPWEHLLERRVGEVVGHVDVPAERGFAHARAPAARGGGPRRRGGGTSRARRRTGSRPSDGTQATLVPSSWRSGTSVSPAEPGQPHEVDGQRAGRLWATRTRSKPVSPSAWTPSVTAPLRPRPGRHSTVGAAVRWRSSRRRRRRRPRTSGGRLAAASTLAAMWRARAARARRFQGAGQAHLGLAEVLHRDEDGDPHPRRVYGGRVPITPGSRRRALVTTIGTLGSPLAGLGAPLGRGRSRRRAVARLVGGRRRPLAHAPHGGEPAPAPRARDAGRGDRHPCARR